MSESLTVKFSNKMCRNGIEITLSQERSIEFLNILNELYYLVKDLNNDFNNGDKLTSNVFNLLNKARDALSCPQTKNSICAYNYFCMRGNLINGTADGSDFILFSPTNELTPVSELRIISPSHNLCKQYFIEREAIFIDPSYSGSEEIRF